MTSGKRAGRVDRAAAARSAVVATTMAAALAAVLASADGAQAQLARSTADRPQAAPPQLLSDGEGPMASAPGASLRLSEPAAPAAATPSEPAAAPTPKPKTIVVAPATAATTVAPAAPAGAGVDAFSVALVTALARGDGELARAYAGRSMAPIWLGADGDRVTLERASALVAAFSVAAEHALPPERYDAETLAARIGALDPTDLDAAAALERDLSIAYLRFAREIGGGVLEPRSVAKSIDVDRPSFPAAPLLATAASATDMRWLLDGLAPRSADYAELKRLYGEVRANLATADAWSAPVPGATSLRRLDRGPRVEALRSQLVHVGFLAEETPSSRDPATGEMLFDDTIHAAVVAFQERKGLAPDGVVGAATLAHLNRDPAEQAMQIAVNLERARWLNRDLGARRIEVNIPDFHARLFEGDRAVFETRVIVGKAQRDQTPEFSDVMTHIVANPYWHVPYSIATEEYLPALRQDPGALDRQNIRIFAQGGGQVDPWSVDWNAFDRGFFPFSMRQDTGPGNALGRVKFIFPNHHNVYLHDTPTKKLFERSVRAFSHGCVRVAEPTALAEALLAAQTPDPAARFEALVSTPGEKYEELTAPVAVHIVYRTAWVDRDGALQLRGDVYGRDREVAAALQRAGLRVR